MKITRLRIRSFKNISDLSIDLDDVNLFIGGKNAGKSSIIQGIHFMISALRSARMYGKSASSPATTLGANQFSFLPTQEIMELNHGSLMTQSLGPKFDINVIKDDGQETAFSLSLYRGKNANVSLSFPRNSFFFSAASDLKNPFSVFVPGLAGIPLSEERRANSIVQTGIAQGDAILFLRNVLYRLEEDRAKKNSLQQLMRGLFSGFQVTTSFDEDVNQFISARVKIGSSSTPLELAGTGCLQALQLAAYVILYEPKLLLLDEPDAHLHPGNQKLLVELIFALAERTGTQILLASHSRHVFDSIRNNPFGAIHWLSEGKVVTDRNADLGLLLDLGALDRYEELAGQEPKVLVFAEDEKTSKIKIILESNGWDTSKCHFVSFNGVDNLEATKVVVDYFLNRSDETRVLVYRDGDGMTPEEREWALKRYTNTLPERAQMYIASMTDVEHHFCLPGHISEVCGIEYEEAFDIVERVKVNEKKRRPKV